MLHLESYALKTPLVTSRATQPISQLNTEGDRRHINFIRQDM